MGQAWCKAKAAQDSKSPFDRVLVRCAHRVSYNSFVLKNAFHILTHISSKFLKLHQIT